MYRDLQHSSANGTSTGAFSPLASTKYTVSPSVYTQFCIQQEAGELRTENLREEVNSMNRKIDQLLQTVSQLRSKRMEFDNYVDTCYPAWREAVIRAVMQLPESSSSNLQGTLPREPQSSANGNADKISPTHGVASSAKRPTPSAQSPERSPPLSPPPTIVFSSGEILDRDFSPRTSSAMHDVYDTRQSLSPPGTVRGRDLTIHGAPTPGHGGQHAPRYKSPPPLAVDSRRRTDHSPMPTPRALTPTPDLLASGQVTPAGNLSPRSPRRDEPSSPLMFRDHSSVTLTVEGGELAKPKSQKPHPQQHQQHSTPTASLTINNGSNIHGGSNRLSTQKPTETSLVVSREVTEEAILPKQPSTSSSKQLTVKTPNVGLDEDSGKKASHSSSTIHFEDKATVPKPSSNKPQIDVYNLTKEGLYRLLALVEEALNGGTSAQEFYQSTAPSSAVSQEIIRCANDPNAGVSHLYAVSVSMVISSQLSTVIDHCLRTERCIFTDECIHKATRNSAYLDESFYSTNMSPGQLELWHRLRIHFAHIVKRHCMTPIEVAELFACDLVHPKSNMEDKMVILLEDILTNLEASLTTDDSLSFPNVTPRPSEKEPPKSKIAAGVAVGPPGRSSNAGVSSSLNQSLMATAGSFHELQLTVNPEHGASEEALEYAKRLKLREQSQNSSTIQSPEYSTSQESTPTHQAVAAKANEASRRDSDMYRHLVMASGGKPASEMSPTSAKHPNSSSPSKSGLSQQYSEESDEVQHDVESLLHASNSKPAPSAAAAAAGGNFSARTDSTSNKSTPRLDAQQQDWSTSKPAPSVGQGMAKSGSSGSISIPGNSVVLAAAKSGNSTTQNLLRSVRDDYDLDESDHVNVLHPVAASASGNTKSGGEVTGKRPQNEDDDFYDFYN